MSLSDPNLELDLEKQQAESEGFAAGPAPALNTQNINTQAGLGVTFPIPVPSIVTPPYYPAVQETPNMRLSLGSMPTNLAENFVLVDAFVGNAINEVGQGGFVPFTTGGEQDHVLSFAAYAGSGTTYTENAIACARFMVQAPVALNNINGKITDGAVGTAPFGKFAIYTADGNTLVTQTKFNIGTTAVGVFSSPWLNAPVFLPAGSYILCWSACGENTPGQAKLSALIQDGLTAMSNINFVSFGTSAQTIQAPLYNFPASLGTLTANNNMTVMPLLFMEL